MKYSKDKVKEICVNLESGLNITDSCLLAGISRETYYKWKKKHVDITDAINKAELRFKQRALVHIQKQGQKNWYAYAWLLERKYQREFALKTKVEHSGGINMTMSRFLEVVYDPGITDTTADETNRIPEKV